MKKFAAFPLLVAVAFIFCLQSASRVFAQPTNDFCTNAIEISPGTVYAIDTSTAASTGDPTNLCSSPFGKGVWFHFTATRNGILTLNTCGSDFDTLIGIYQGDCDALTFYSCADDNGPACPGNQASWSIPVMYNTSFYIVVGGYDGAGGHLQFTTLNSGPANDQCDAAIALTNAVGYQMDLFGATATNDPPNCRLYSSPGVWFKYTPTNTGPLTISTAGSGFTPDIEVFTGNCANPVKTFCGIIQPTLHFQATNGVTYLIFLSDYNYYAPYGEYDAHAQVQIAVEEGTVPNDSCSGAIPLTNGVPYFTSTITATSTNDPMPVCGGSINDSTWYTFTPASNGLVTISTCGSEFATDLQIYTGTCTSLVPLPGGCIGSAGPACSSRASVTFEAAANTNYYILAGSVAVGAIGKLEIQATLSPPLNDRCQNAIPMQDGIIYTRNTVASTTNGDPSLSNFANGVWYTFTPASNGVVTISTCGSDFPTAMQVYTGSCNALSAVPEGGSADNISSCTNSRATVSFEGSGGVTYYVLVGSYGAVAGNLQIQAALSPPLNDRCTNATPMQDGIVYTRNTDASTSAGDPNPSCGYSFGKGVWYTYTPASNGIVTIITCGSDFNTGLSVYTGSCGALTPFPDDCNSGFGPACSSNRASLVFEGVGGVTYYILAGGQDAATGNLQIQATLSPSLNDHCENALAMQDSVVYKRNTAMSTSTGDPVSSCGYPIGRAVWYTYAPASNGVVTVSTCGSDFDTVLQVYTGSCGALTKPPLDSCNGGFGPACPTYRASIAFEGMAGVTYHILAGGQGGATGHLQIQAILSPLLPNDHCDGAIALTNGVTYAENTATATSTGDPLYWYDNKGVWFSFTPATDGVLAVNTCGSDYPTEIQIYTGGCNSLTPLPDGNNWGYGPLCQTNQASLVISAHAGTNYLIFVAGVGGDLFGNLQIQTTLLPALANDQCNGATDISSGGVYLMDTTFATSAGDATNDCGGHIVRGVWYRLTPSATALITISLESSNVYPVLQLFEGTCGQLTNLVCAADYYNAPFTSLAFTGVAGRTYFLQAGGVYGTVGNLKMTVGAFPPPNYQCFNAVSMNTGVKYTINNSYAPSTNNPVPLCNATAGHGLWYRYTPLTDSEITVETCDSDFETVLQVYSGSCGSLTPVACNDGFGPACATNRASLSFSAKTGTNYYIFAAGKNGAFGNLSISANGPPPTNDTCDAAIDMIEDVVYTTNTIYASSTGDGFPVTKGVWYRFTPTRAGLLRLSTCGSDFNTAFNVYTGPCDALTYFNGAATDFMGLCPTHQTTAEFAVSLGTTYYIDVGGSGGASGNLSIVATMPVPTNDTCAGAVDLGNGFLYHMNTANATEAGDPTPTCQTNFGKGVWFTFTPPMSGTVSISTCNGDLDTVMQVYIGGCGALTPVANTCNDDNGPDCNSFTASVHFHGDAGVTYWILVGGYGGAGGNLGIEANVLPVLTVNRAGTNTILSWPDRSFHAYFPEFTTNLTPPVVWKPIPQIIGSAYVDGNYIVTNSIPGNSIFYRLKK